MSMILIILIFLFLSRNYLYNVNQLKITKITFRKLRDCGEIIIEWFYKRMATYRHLIERILDNLGDLAINPKVIFLFCLTRCKNLSMKVLAISVMEIVMIWRKKNPIWSFAFCICSDSMLTSPCSIRVPLCRL